MTARRDALLALPLLGAAAGVGAQAPTFRSSDQAATSC